MPPKQHLGSGGASAPTTGEPMIAPGVHRPDWATPEYAKLPWQRKLARVEHYADGVINGRRRERSGAMGLVMTELERYTLGKPLNVSQLDAALILLETDNNHPDLWQKAMEIDAKAAPVRGSGDTFNAHDASEMLAKFRQIAG